MSQELFDALSSLCSRKDIDFSSLHKELHALVGQGLRQSRRRVIVRFLSILETLAQLPESEEARTLITKGLETLLALSEGRLNNKDGAGNITLLSVSAREALKPFFYRGLLCNENFLARLAWDLQKDAEELQACLDQNNPKKTLFLIRMIKDDFSYVGMQVSAEIAEATEHLQEESVYEAFSQKNAESLKTFITFLRQTSEFLSRNKGGGEVIARREEQLLKDASSIVDNLKKPYQEMQGVILTSEEVSALLNDETSHQTVFTALPDTPAYTPKPLSLEERKAMGEHQDRLVKLAGKLFLKQELLKALVPKEQKILAGDRLESLEGLTQKLKDDLFKNYYISLKKLLGQELREFVQKEVDRLGKKVRLGVRGENCEILTREGDFVKDLVFRLAGNAMSYSIEMPERRLALEKTEGGRLIVSFEDIGEEFQITVQDDGRGFNDSTMDFDGITQSLEERGGVLNIESTEGEMLKICARFPMKKLITKSVLCRCGSLYLLMPFRSILKIVPAESMENPAISKDSNCLGQIAFSALMGSEKCPNKMALVCSFGDKNIVYTAEEILGEIEALSEESDVPLPPCCDNAVILSSDRIGFLLNERLLFSKSQSILEKRAENLKAFA